jgi:hypothetical protein
VCKASITHHDAKQNGRIAPKKAPSLVIGKEPLLIADYFDWVDVLKISR